MHDRHCIRTVENVFQLSIIERPCPSSTNSVVHTVALGLLQLHVCLHLTDDSLSSSASARYCSKTTLTYLLGRHLTSPEAASLAASVK